MNNLQEYQNINQRKGFPRSYWFNQFIRWFTIIFSILAITYALWIIFTKINTDSTSFAKIVPFLIIFFALNSLFRNVFSLNRLMFRQEALEFHYLLRKTTIIAWNDFISIKMVRARQRVLDIKYQKSEGEAIQELTLAFPKMLEILNAIIEMTPQVKLDDFMESIVIGEGDKIKQPGSSSDENA